MTLAGVVDKKYLFGLAAGLIVALFSLQETVAQITSATADHVDTLSYPAGNPARDPLFVFYQLDGVSKPGSLTASYTGGGDFNFEWSMYNPAIS